MSGILTRKYSAFPTRNSDEEKHPNGQKTSLEDAFIVSRVERYDIKGRKYISTPQKYYFTDLGLRNARLNFRQQEETHLMENALYNELLFRGYQSMWELSKSANKAGEKTRKWTSYAMKAVIGIIYSLRFAWIRRRRRCRRANP